MKTHAPYFWRGLVMVGLCVALALVGHTTLSAQTAPPDDAPDGDGETRLLTEITYDEVNAIARRIFCPVCDSEPLHTCMAPTCFEWRAEIRSQLADGRTEQEIIDYFVAESGEQVVGLPQSSGLRRLALAGPVVAVVLAGGLGLMTLRGWRRKPDDADDLPPSDSPLDDNYRSRLEEDLHR